MTAQACTLERPAPMDSEDGVATVTELAASELVARAREGDRSQGSRAIRVRCRNWCATDQNASESVASSTRNTVAGLAVLPS